jgi:type IV pilus assembly protein PilW
MKSSVRGFTLVELMVGLAIGLIATLAMVSVMINSEEQKRSTTGGMDAQVNGALALSAMMREIEKAGYGFTSNPAIIGCPLQNKYKGGSLNSMPASLVPVVITAGLNGAPDTIRSVAGNKNSFSVPINLVNPAYAPGAKFFNVSSVRGVQGPILNESGNVVATGDLMVVATDSTTPCQVFEVTADPAGSAVNRDDTANWNTANFPDQGYAYGSVLVNLGNLRDVAFSVQNEDLVQTSFILAKDGTASYQNFTLFNNIVQLQALYGKDVNGDGSVDSWDKTTPVSNAEWMQVIAVRVALVSRSTQREKEVVTSSNPQWDVGTGNPVTGAATCGTSKCLTLKIDNLTDWDHYRYKVFDTVIPLRNMLWKS